MSRIRRKRNNRIRDILIAITAGIIALIALFGVGRTWLYRLSADFLYPYISIPAAGAEKISDSSMLMRSRRELAAEVIELRRENARLSTTMAQLAPLKIRNDELQRLLSLKPDNGFNPIFAQLVMRDPLYWERRFTINKGSEDGIFPGDTVVVPVMLDGKAVPAVVGRIGVVAKRSAEVCTLFNPETRLTIKVPENSAIGFMQGGGVDRNGAYAMVRQLPCELKYKNNMRVYSAGYSRSVPSDVYLGQLDQPEPRELIHGDRIYLNARLRPAVPLDAIHFVMVMTRGI